MCTMEGGSVCLNDDNAPFPCSDYKIRYFCKCNGKLVRILEAFKCKASEITAFYICLNFN